MAYFSPGNCLTYLKDDELAVYLCNPSDGYLPFIFATLESACPFLGDPLSRILPAIDTMENMDRSRREDAEPFLQTEDIRFMNARNVENNFLQFFKNILDGDCRRETLSARQMLRNVTQKSR